MEQATRAKPLKATALSSRCRANRFSRYHSKAILRVIQPPSYGEKLLAEWPGPVEVTREWALALAESIWTSGTRHRQLCHRALVH